MKKINRREFIKSGSGIAAAITFGTGLASIQSQSSKNNKSSKLIGIQIGAPSFVDEGVEDCLDSIQERACVNTLFVMVYSYKEGLSGRTWPPVDHGRQYKGPEFHGGYYATIHSKYYIDTIFKDNPQILRAPDEGNFDLLTSVLPVAKQRGIKTIAWLADQVRDDIPQFQEMAEVDLHGHKLNQVCLNNPQFQSFLKAMVEDCVTSYDIDGLLWRSERWGALTNTLYKWDGVGKTAIPCFCPFCLEKGTKNGINIKRVIEGYKTLTKFVADTRKDQRPPEGYYAVFWRILLRYPEILAWEMFWYDSLRETYKIVYTKGKSIKPKLPIGSAIPHSISFNPFYRAIVDLQELSKYNDFLKIIFYNMDAGPRCCNYVDNVFGTYLKDLSREDRLLFMYGTMGFSEGNYDKIKSEGMSAEYVSKETKTWLEAARGTKLQVLSGIDVDVSPNNDDLPRSREGVRDTVLAAFQAGAPGIVLSRMYSEMMLDHLSGAGDAIRQLGLD
ncbi:MAG: hypothetical protein JSW07_22850 [bacterium]|nr:MAG: hypothetical protein JSW07_22850 [bacterium]